VGYGLVGMGVCFVGVLVCLGWVGWWLVIVGFFLVFSCIVVRELGGCCRGGCVFFREVDVGFFGFCVVSRVGLILFVFVLQVYVVS